MAPHLAIPKPIPDQPLTRSSWATKQPRAIVAMEACATAHEWGRAISGLGHDVRLVPPIYVKPFVRRQKNDAADAEAIAEAGVTEVSLFPQVSRSIPHLGHFADLV